MEPNELNESNELNGTSETEKPKFVYGELVSGEISFINSVKGYGFITSRERPFERFFFHWTSLRPGSPKFPENYHKGMKVRFIEAHNEELGPRAIKVEVLKESE